MVDVPASCTVVESERRHCSVATIYELNAQPFLNVGLSGSTLMLLLCVCCMNVHTHIMSLAILPLH